MEYPAWEGADPRDAHTPELAGSHTQSIYFTLMQVFI